MKIESFINSVAGEHFDVIADVEVKILHDIELDYSTITNIEACPSDEPLDSLALKVNGLHELPRMLFTQRSVAQLKTRLEEDALEQELHSRHAELQAELGNKGYSEWLDRNA